MEKNEEKQIKWTITLNNTHDYMAIKRISLKFFFNLIVNSVGRDHKKT